MHFVLYTHEAVGGQEQNAVVWMRMASLGSHIWILGPQLMCWCCSGRRNSLDGRSTSLKPITSPYFLSSHHFQTLRVSGWRRDVSACCHVCCLTLFLRPDGHLLFCNNMPEHTLYSIICFGYIVLWQQQESNNHVRCWLIFVYLITEF